MGAGSVRFLQKLTAEGWLTGVMAFVGLFGLIFMSSLVAAPKVLFGRSLTAIPPSLFPTLVLSAMAALALMHLYSIRKTIFSDTAKVFDGGGLRRVVMLFAVMFLYALTMERIGFFFSSAIAMAAVGWVSGNRSIPQIVIVSLIGPIALYVLSTRGLAVSLPELSWIEFLYAGVFDAFSGAEAPSAEGATTEQDQ